MRVLYKQLYRLYPRSCSGFLLLRMIYYNFTTGSGITSDNPKECVRSSPSVHIYVFKMHPKSMMTDDTERKTQSMIRTDPVSTRTAPLTHVSARLTHCNNVYVTYCMYSVQIRAVPWSADHGKQSKHFETSISETGERDNQLSVCYTAGIYQLLVESILMM